MDGNKATLIELIKGVHATVAHFDSGVTQLGASLSVPYLVAALFAAIDTHREHYLTFTTDEKLDELQARVKPSTWDSLFLQAGQTSKKQEKFAQQLESERKRDYNEAVHNKSAYPNGIIPANSPDPTRARDPGRLLGTPRAPLAPHPATPRCHPSTMPRSSADQQRGRR